MNEEKEILTRLQYQFYTFINGAGDYNYNILEADVHLDWKAVQEVNVFPSIYIASFVVTRQRLTDQATIESRFEVEVFGYAKAVDNSDCLEEGSKLFNDMRNAYHADEFLNSKIYDPNFSIGLSTYDPWGIVYGVLRGEYETTKPS